MFGYTAQRIQPSQRPHQFTIFPILRSPPRPRSEHASPGGLWFSTFIGKPQLQLLILTLG